MSNSSLVDYTKLVKNYTPMNDKVNKKITIHHMAGNLSVETCANVFNGTRKASSNYGIGTDGRVGLYVEEKNRAWTSSNKTNDSQAVTIEVANDTIGGDWHVSDKAFNKLIELCIDICKRNNINKLVWTGDKNGTLTCHYMFDATACPGPYLKSKMQLIANRVNIALKNGSNEEKEESAFKPFSVKVAISDLNIRSGAGTNYKRVKYIPKGIYTIVEIKQGQGSKKGWGRLKSGIGWISLDYVSIV